MLRMGDQMLAPRGSSTDGRRSGAASSPTRGCTLRSRVRAAVERVLIGGLRSAVLTDKSNRTSPATPRLDGRLIRA